MTSALGGAPCGEANGIAKLTAEQVVEIHARLRAGESHSSIGRAFGCSHKTIGGIATGRTWAHLGLGPVPRPRDAMVAARKAAEAARRPRPTTPRVDDAARFVDDATCRALVVHHPDGMDLVQIGEALGVTSERVRQIEAQALVGLRARCQLAGISADDFVASLTARRTSALAGAADRFADPDDRAPTSRNGGVRELDTTGPLEDLEALLAAVERRAEFVDDVTRIARRHA